MPIPGYDVSLVDVPAPRGASTGTDPLFLIDFASQGPLNVAQEILSPDQSDTIFGAVQPAWGKLQDCLDVYFALGGSKAYVVRAGGPAATESVDDHAAITATEWQKALDAFGVALGPGQLVVPAFTTATLQALQVAHGWANNRFSLLTPLSSANDAALTTMATAAIALPGGRFASLWRDYVTVPGRVYGTTRTVPWSIVQAGLISASDQATRNPNREAAGKNGIAEYVQAIVSEVDDTRRATLRTAQVNTAKTIYGQARAYGARTLADLTKISHWWNVGGARTVMAARALIAAVDEDEVFGQLDGQGQELALYNGKVKGALEPLLGVGALWEQPRVDTSPAVNTAATIAAGEKRARVTLKTSPTAEHVVTFLSRVALDQTA